MLSLIFMFLVTCLHSVYFQNFGLEDPAPGRSPGPPDLFKSDCFELPNSISNQTGYDFIDFRIRHKLFNSSVLTYGFNYQVLLRIKNRMFPINESEIQLSISSSLKFHDKEVAFGYFKGNKKNTTIGNCWNSITLEMLNKSFASLIWFASGNISEIFSNDFIPLEFRIRIRLGNRANIIQSNYNFTLRYNCNLEIQDIFSSELSSLDLPKRDCKITFPNLKNNYGLIIELKQFSVACKYENSIQYGFIKFDNHPEICGKFEQLTNKQRIFYYPYKLNQSSVSFKTEGQPIFKLDYKLVDFCYNMTFRNQSGIYDLYLNNQSRLSCSFRFWIPYGFKVNVNLEYDLCKSDRLNIRFWNGFEVIDVCSNKSNLLMEQSLRFSAIMNKAILWIEVNQSLISNNKVLRIIYNTTREIDIAKNCQFGWVNNGETCLKVYNNEKLNWFESELRCQEHNGYLVRILNEKIQYLIDQILSNDPENDDSSSYWIGASDRIQEGDFRWTNGQEVVYKNWFPGWLQFNYFNKQPNDDSFSEQDCLEIRKSYHIPMGSVQFMSSYTWNDRNCFAINYFICERKMNNDSTGKDSHTNCDRSIFLSRFQPQIILTSPDFPRKYPDNIQCNLNISTIDDYKLIFEFDEFDLENELNCNYDYFEFINQFGHESKKICGDWSSKLKLLRYVSNSSDVKIRFVSDYSNHYGGYKIRVSIENNSQCLDDKLKKFNNSCYLFVNYPTVTWKTARNICNGINAELTSIVSSEEQEFITNTIRKIPDNKINSIYWLGACKNIMGKFEWIDKSVMSFVNFHPLFQKINSNFETCLTIEWSSEIPNGFYWNEKYCHLTAGFVCKKHELINSSNSTNIGYNNLELNEIVVNQTHGSLYSPNYPENYFNNLDYSVTILGYESSRVFVNFQFIDIEPQADCLYDYLTLISNEKTRKICGSYNESKSNFSFLSESNTILLQFHSDYSINKQGYFADWKTIDVSNCPQQVITATEEGTISSINYPHFLITNLNCTITILAPYRKRIWLRFLDYDSSDDFIEINLGKHDSFVLSSNYNFKTLTFLSHYDKLHIIQRINKNTIGRGFNAVYELVDYNFTKIHNTLQLSLNNNLNDFILRPINYPSTRKILNVDYLQHLIAPISYNIILKFFHVQFGIETCLNIEDRIEVIDNYAGDNGTKWYLCETNESKFHDEEISSSTSLTIKSHFNTLYFRQIISTNRFNINALLKLSLDEKHRNKLIDSIDRLFVESCNPNPCLNNGKCIQNKTQFICQCTTNFTGLFCALTVCDLKPCVSGKCALTENNNVGFECTCDKGYTGQFCDIKKKPCDDNPCENRGVCIAKGSGFFCQCHAWWEGVRCERKIIHIPYKSLSERMFKEPFWLGLITVFVVMAIIGLVWCARKHFPEKLEKLLTEEADRNRSSNYALRSTILNDTRLSQYPGHVNDYVSTDYNNRKSLLCRFGIRKLSLLSLNSYHSNNAITNKKYIPRRMCRAFSLDDVLKPLAITSNGNQNNQSPKEKMKKEDSGSKRRILKQLLKPVEPKVKSESLTELSTFKKLKKDLSKEDRFEKKVTFAKLLNKVSNEIKTDSSGDVDLNKTTLKQRRKSLSLNTLHLAVPHAISSSSSSSNSLTSDQVTSFSLNEFFRKNIRYPIRKKQRITSADSLFTEVRKCQENESKLITNDNFENTSISSGNVTPISFSSNYSESSQNLKNLGNVIEVTVIDSSSSNSSNNFLFPPSILLENSNTNNNKCHLSPIHEIPTPLASPLTRSTRSVHSSRSESIDDIRLYDENSDDKISIEFPTFSVSYSDGENEFRGDNTLAELPSEENSLISESNETIKQIKLKPPPIKNKFVESNNETTTCKIIVPKLIVQEPSPTQKNPPLNLFIETKPTLDTPTIRIIENSPSIEIRTITNEETSVRKDSTTSTTSQSGMCLLSPFQRPDRINSESNLSSSGYSSMASPGSSRCNSNNPLYENDETNLLMAIKMHNFNKKPSPLLKSPIIHEQEQVPVANDNQIIEQVEDIEPKISNDNSRSESSLSETTDTLTVPRNSTMYSDSDCTYDHSSSDYQKTPSISELINKYEKLPIAQQHRKTFRRKDVKKIPSPVKKSMKIDKPFISERLPRKTSPRRKSKLIIPSSSSSESLSSNKQSSKYIECSKLNQVTLID